MLDALGGARLFADVGAPDSSMCRPIVLTDQRQARLAVAESRAAGKSIGVVLTMGALHEGHLSLVRVSQQECDTTYVTIFLNPTQFAPHEDLSRYPRNLDEDLHKLRGLEVEYAFVPHESEIYPPGFSTFVQPPAISKPLEGECRPGHFRGVATVVLKLLQLIPADRTYFGEKDFQQCLVVRQMLADLNVPVAIRTCPTVRDSDGLAMSSRNRYLNRQEREQALALSRGLTTIRQQFDGGQRDVAVLVAELRQKLKQAQIARVDYATIRDAETLDSIRQVDRPARALIAAYVGSTRLIDNCALG